MNKIVKTATITLLALFCLTGCKKDREESGATTYTLINKINFALVGYDIDTYLYEYDASDALTDSNVVESPSVGQAYPFTASVNTHHVKLKLVSSENTVRWASKIFVLEPHRNTDIVAGLSLLTDNESYCFNEPRYNP